MEKNKRLELYNKLKENFEVELDADLSKHTTWRIGGKAEALLIIKEKEKFIKLFKFIEKHKLPHVILGMGANVLVSDKGVKKLVVKNKVEGIEVGEKVHNFEKKLIKTPRVERGVDQKAVEEDNHYTFEDLDFEDNSEYRTKVKIYSGTNLYKVINETLDRGYTGLQWFAGIPATVGGAIFNNIHGGNYHIGDFLLEIEAIVDGSVKKIKTKDLDLGYDYSIIHETKWPVLSATFLLGHDNVEKAKETAKEWLVRKVIQPKKSCGCVFKNIPKERAEELGLPSESTGYIIDRLLDMKGYRVGNMQISKKHAGFIENLGNGKVEDAIKIIIEMEKRAKEELNLELEEEIVYMGDFSEYEELPNSFSS